MNRHTKTSNIQAKSDLTIECDVKGLSGIDICNRIIAFRLQLENMSKVLERQSQTKVNIDSFVILFTFEPNYKKHLEVQYNSRRQMWKVYFYDADSTTPKKQPLNPHPSWMKNNAGKMEKHSHKSSKFQSRIEESIILFVDKGKMP